MEETGMAEIEMAGIDAIEIVATVETVGTLGMIEIGEMIGIDEIKGIKNVTRARARIKAKVNKVKRVVRPVQAAGRGLQQQRIRKV
jgi:hypothetical protein